MTNTITVKEAVLSNKLDNLKEQVAKIDIKIDIQNKHIDSKFEEINRNYVTQAQLNSLKKEFTSFKQSVRLNYLVIIIITAFITALIYHTFKQQLP